MSCANSKMSQEEKSRPGGATAESSTDERLDKFFKWNFRGVKSSRFQGGKISRVISKKLSFVNRKIQKGIERGKVFIAKAVDTVYYKIISPPPALKSSQEDEGQPSNPKTKRESFSLGTQKLTIDPKIPLVENKENDAQPQKLAGVVC